MLLLSLGLSHRASSLIFSSLNVLASFMTVWRDVQVEAQGLKRRTHWKPTQVMGLDGANVLGWGEKQPVLIAVDLGEGQPVMIGFIDKHDSRAVKRWLEPLITRLGVSMIVTDDLWVYRQVADDLNLAHLVCQSHVRCWVGRELHRLKEKISEAWAWVVEKI